MSRHNASVDSAHSKIEINTLVDLLIQIEFRVVISNIHTAPDS